MRELLAQTTTWVVVTDSSVYTPLYRIEDINGQIIASVRTFEEAELIARMRNQLGTMLQQLQQ